MSSIDLYDTKIVHLSNPFLLPLISTSTRTSTRTSPISPPSLLLDLLHPVRLVLAL